MSIRAVRMGSMRVGLSLLVSAVLLAGCASPPEDPPSALDPNLRLLLGGSASDEVDEVWIRWSEVKLHAHGGWTAVADAGGEADLLSLHDGVIAELASSHVEPGRYDQVRLSLDDAWVIVDGVREPLRVPSADESGLALMTSFDVPECGAIALTLDWEIGAHLTHAPGAGWILRPTIRASARGAAQGALDVNGDAQPDLVLAGRLDPSTPARDALVMLGHQGGFPSITSALTAPGALADWPTAGANLGDVDGDGLTDVALADASAGTVAIHLGRTDGLASEPAEVLREGSGCTRASPAGSCYGRGVSAGDLDGDGHTDLAVLSKEQVYVYRGNNRGLDRYSYVVRDPVYDGTTSDAYGESGAIVPDVNGDGIDDLVVGAPGASSTHRLAGHAFVHYGSPSGASGAALELAPACAHDGCQWGALAIGDDFDRDGFGDVVLGARGELSLALFRGGPSGISTSAIVIEVDDAPLRLAPLGDFTGDGFADLAMLTHGHGVEVFRGAPGGLESEPIRVPTRGPIGTSECELVGLGDVDGDGRTDLATSQALADDDGIAGPEGAIWIQLGRDADARGPDTIVPGPASIGGLSLVPHLGYVARRTESCH